MNKKILFISIIISLLFSFGILKAYKAFSGSNKYLFLMQIGAYSNYDNVLNVTNNLTHYLVSREGDLYKVYIAASSSDKTYDKLFSIYKDKFDIYKKCIDITNFDISDKIEKYDEAIMMAKSNEVIDLIVNDEFKMLSKYIN